MRWTAADEGRHDDAPGLESWGFELAAGRVTGLVRLTVDLAHRRAGFLADFSVRPAGRVVVADEEVPVPRRESGLDVRADGLWASLHCETPFEHWSLGLEAFGLRLEGDPLEGHLVDASSWDQLIGERIPVGFDLEWELRAAPEPLADGAGYSQVGVVFGELLVVRDRIPVEGAAVREHWWGGAPGVRNDPSPTLGD